MKTVIESPDINVIRAALRARGFECDGTKGWMRNNKPAAIYFKNGIWFTVVKE